MQINVKYSKLDEKFSTMECLVNNLNREESQVKLRRIIMKIHKITNFKIISKITIKRKDNGLTVVYLYCLNVVIFIISNTVSWMRSSVQYSAL